MKVCPICTYIDRLPESVSLDEGALMEPLSVAIHSCRRAGVSVGDRVLVLGSGPIGLMCLLTARTMGAAKVAVTDIKEDRLAFAVKMGATAGVKIDASLSPKDMAEKVIAEVGWQPNVTIECSGADSSFQMGINVTEPGGVVQIVGYSKPVMSFPHFVAGSREIDIRATMRYANTYPTAVSMLASKLVDVTPLITHRFPLGRSDEAFRTAETGAGNGAIKVMIHCDE